MRHSGKFSDVLTREIPITDYAEKLGFHLLRKGRYFSLKEHDSVMIDAGRNAFWRNSTGAKGSVIDFCLEFGGAVNVSDAMRILSEMYGIHTDGERAQNVQVPTVVPPKRERAASEGLELPPKADNVRAVFRYLIHERRIQKSVIRYFLAKKMLYQDDHRNCVFCTPSFGCIRGTGEKHWTMDCVGNDYDECFFFRGSNAAKGLIVAESVIDVMSVMSYFTLKGKKYTDYCYLALAGTNKYESVFHHLKKEGEGIDTVYLCLDNDKAGKLAAKKIEETMKNDFQSVNVKKAFAPSGKDWNDYIKTITPEQD